MRRRKGSFLGQLNWRARRLNSSMRGALGSGVKAGQVVKTRGGLGFEMGEREGEVELGVGIEKEVGIEWDRVLGVAAIVACVGSWC